jgi:hypothetical protein
MWWILEISWLRGQDDFEIKKVYNSLYWFLKILVSCNPVRHKMAGRYCSQSFQSGWIKSVTLAQLNRKVIFNIPQP